MKNGNDLAGSLILVVIASEALPTACHRPLPCAWPLAEGTAVAGSPLDSCCCPAMSSA